MDPSHTTTQRAYHTQSATTGQAVQRGRFQQASVAYEMMLRYAETGRGGTDDDEEGPSAAAAGGEGEDDEEVSEHAPPPFFPLCLCVAGCLSGCGCGCCSLS